MLDRMQALAQQGVQIQLVLDVGSYHGQFGDMIHEVWPQAHVISLEADHTHAAINPGQITVCLGSQDNTWVEFHTLPGAGVKTGASYYKELTPYYQTSVSMPMQTVTLDTLCAQQAWHSELWSTQGMIKLDTQGSELDILRGAHKFLQSEQPRYILAEVSHKPYNLNAPRASEVIHWLHERGYQFVDVWGITYDTQNSLLQTDILFERQS